MKIIRVSDNNFDEIVSEASAALTKGKIIIGESDTVYGLYCDAQNKNAVKQLFKIKNRPSCKPIPVFVKDLAAARGIAFINKQQQEFLNKFWPGKLTAVLKSKIHASNPYFSDTIGVRVPNDKFLLQILANLDCPIAETSANISGNSSLIKFVNVLNEFKTSKFQPDLAFDAGNLPSALPSTVVDLTGNKPRVLRQGAIKIG